MTGTGGGIRILARIKYWTLLLALMNLRRLIQGRKLLVSNNFATECCGSIHFHSVCDFILQGRVGLNAGKVNCSTKKERRRNIFMGVQCLRKNYAIGGSPCQHGMARPQVADGGNGLQIWRITANILNKQTRTADKVWSSSLGVGRGANNSSS
jgi:hypothetical protein